MKKIKHLSLRLPEDLLEKFHVVCKYNGRSANSQLLYYIRNMVESHENKHGKIEIVDEDK